MDRFYNLSTDATHKAFTSLGKALEFFHRIDSTQVETLEQLAQSEQEHPEPSQFQEQRKVLGSISGNLSSLKPLLEGFDQNTVEKYDALVKAHQDLLDMREAISRGIIDQDEASKDLKRLRIALGDAERKAQGLPPGARLDQLDLESGSLWGKSETLAGIRYVGETAGKGIRAIGSQVGGVLTGSLGLLSSLPVAGGLFSLLLYGYIEKNRMQTQMGELQNLVVASGGDTASKATSWMAEFQEKAQDFYGISRSVVQSNIKSFIDAGYKTDAIFSNYGRVAGEASHNVVTMSLAMDRSFDLSSGFSSRTSVQLIQQYGINLQHSVDDVAKLEFAANKGGFGVSSFVGWTLQANSQVRDLGVKTDEIAAVALEMQRELREKGSSVKSFATSSIDEMVSGFSDMGLGREVWAAEKLGMGSGLEGRQHLLQGFYEGRTDMLTKMASIWRKEALGASHGDELEARFYLERQGFGFQGSKAILHIGAMEEKGLGLANLTVQDKKFLQEAFVRSGLSVSQNKRNLKDALLGLARVGQGLLLILTNFAGMLIVAIESFPVIFHIVGNEENRKSVSEAIDVRMQGIARGWQNAKEGGLETYHALGSIVGPLVEPLDKAITSWLPKPTENQPTQIPRHTLPPEETPAGSMIPELNPQVPKLDFTSLEHEPRPVDQKPPPSLTSRKELEHASFDINQMSVKWEPGSQHAHALQLEVHLEYA